MHFKKHNYIRRNKLPLGIKHHNRGLMEGGRIYSEKFISQLKYLLKLWKGNRQSYLKLNNTLPTNILRVMFSFTGVYLVPDKIIGSKTIVKITGY